MLTPKKIRVPEKGTSTSHAFERYSLLGSFEELSNRLSKRVLLLGALCLQGEALVIYARYNTGKTLIAISLIIDMVANTRIRGGDVIYVNADDSAHGALEKLAIFEEYGVHMVAPGYNGFAILDLTTTMIEMIESGTAAGKLIIVDTLKRAVDLMDKKRVRAFTEVVRAFTMQGGTFVALAHTNKNPGSDGKPVPEGTGDIMNDFDTVYLLDRVGDVKGSGDRMVEFTCKKSRGDVKQIAHYRYDADPSLSYVDRLFSVQEVDPQEAKYADVDERSRSDAEVIQSIELSIKHGTGTKMETVRKASSATHESQRSIIAILDRFTGDDPLVHRWNYKRGERGRMDYYLLDRPEHPPG